MSPKVSVLIPTFNYARYLAEAIESVLAQDFRDFELLISDDCSLDDSAGVIRKYAAKDSRIRFQIHPSNLGLVQNWNWCLSQSRGEFIQYLFGDDKLLSSGALGKLAGMLDVNPSAAMAVAARNLIDERSQTIGVRDNLRVPGLHSGRKIILQSLEANVNLIGEPTTVMFRKGAGLRGFDVRYRQIPDLEMWFHLLENADLVYGSEPLSAFRVHPLQQTKRNQREGLDARESLLLMTELYSKQWLREAASRKLWFAQLYALRKGNMQSDAAQQLDRGMAAAIGTGWYAAYWVSHKLTKPARNLARFFCRNRRPASA